MEVMISGSLAAAIEDIAREFDWNEEPADWDSCCESCGQPLDEEGEESLYGD